MPITTGSNETVPLVGAPRDTKRSTAPLAAEIRHHQGYCHGTKRWPALCCRIDDGRLEIDNNISEHALRGVAVGRRNWLFAGSKTDGERATAIYTVIPACKDNGVNPQAYIADIH